MAPNFIQSGNFFPGPLSPEDGEAERDERLPADGSGDRVGGAAMAKNCAEERVALPFYGPSESAFRAVEYPGKTFPATGVRTGGEAEADFAPFPGLKWKNPLVGGGG